MVTPMVTSCAAELVATEARSAKTKKGG